MVFNIDNMGANVCILLYAAWKHLISLKLSYIKSSIQGGFWGVVNCLVEVEDFDKVVECLAEGFEEHCLMGQYYQHHLGHPCLLNCKESKN